MKLLDEQSTSETESGIPLNQALEELSLYKTTSGPADEDVSSDRT